MTNILLSSISILLVVASISCKKSEDQPSVDIWKEEIKLAEASFARMAMESGVEKAFLTYAAPDAVLMRSNTIIKGVDEIQRFFASQQSDQKASLTWSPDFVDASASGDLGYTYGQYTYQGIDSAGQIYESKGIFHTVWKRQSDGSWRFVWD